MNDFYGINGSNILESSTSLNNSNVNVGIKDSHASFLRYPGGTDANYWDWQEGWFFRNMDDNGPISMDIDFQKKQRLASVFNGSLLRESWGDYLEDYAAALATTGTKPLFVLNPLTSDLNYQIAMLLEAKLRNLAPGKIEIGNEFYLSRTAYQEKYGNSDEYANLVSTWRSTIKNYLGNVEISAVAANKDYLNGTNGRRDNWNPILYNSLAYTLNIQGTNNSCISTNIIVNENEKQINKILINHRLKGFANLSALEANIILSIATQCPREGGASVYRARTLMYKINRNIKYNDDVYCNTIAARKGKNLIENDNEYSMTPDCQNNVLKFISKNQNDDLLVVKIFDLQGKLIASSPLNGNGSSKLFPFYFSKEAFYLVNLTDSKNHSYNFKLIW